MILNIFKDIRECSQGEKNQAINYEQYALKYMKYYVYIIYGDGKKDIKNAKTCCYLLLVALWVKCVPSLCFPVLL